MSDYTPRIDLVLTLAQHLSFTTGDFAALAVAAADQAGMSAADQQTLARQLAPCGNCGEHSAITPCAWAETCGECDRHGEDMAKERMCEECAAVMMKAAKSEMRRLADEGRGDWARDCQKDAR